MNGGADLTNPWDEGGSLASDWSADNAEALNTSAIGGALGKQGTPIILAEPQAIAQPTRTTCWAGALLSWLYASNIPRNTQFQLPEDLITLLKPKNFTNGNPMLRSDDSLAADALDLWGEAISKVISACGSSQTIACSRRSPGGLTHEFLTKWIMDGKYILIGEIRDAAWRHAYVVYGVDCYTKKYPFMLTMDPDGGVYLEKPIPPSQGIFFCTTI